MAVFDGPVVGTTDFLVDVDGSLPGKGGLVKPAIGFGLAAAILWIGCGSQPGDAPTTPSQVYLDYRAALANARTMSEVLPHLSASYRGLESFSEGEQQQALENFRFGVRQTELQVTEETIDGDTCRLEVTGTNQFGKTVKGRVTMVREDGAWKFEEESW
jgi:hypothetical protein